MPSFTLNSKEYSGSSVYAWGYLHRTDVCMLKIFSPLGSILFCFSLHGVFSCSEVFKIIRSNALVIFL